MIRFLHFVSFAVLFFGAPAQAEGPLMKRLQTRLAEKQAGDVATAEVAGLKLAYWLPEQAGPAPLVIFSHGFGGCKTQSKFLMQALADHGYLVVAPDHADAMCGKGFSRPEEKFRDIPEWTAQTYRNRGEDIKRLYAALKDDKEWQGRIEWTRVALAGHSLGGYTALALAGAWPSWKMEGIHAVLALSPYAAPLLDHGGLGNISVPVMYQGGTRDIGITPLVKKPDGVFEHTPSPAYFVEFESTGHFGWTDLVKGAQPEITAYSLWFLGHALNRDGASPPDAGNVTDWREK